MYKFIFLDVDGVLVTEDSLAKSNDKHMRSFDKICVNNLNLLVRRTHAQLILSSNWKTLMSLGDFNTHAKREGLEYLCSDITPLVHKYSGNGNLIPGYGSREEEINEFLNIFKDRGEINYVVFDDMDLKIDNFIRTENKNGLTKEHVQRAIMILGEV